MKNNELLDVREMNPAARGERRRLLQTALVIAAGGGLQTLAQADPVAASGKHTGKRQSQWASPMQDAIKACLDCHSMCLQMAMGFCLERGGRHAEKKHLRLMLNCAGLCLTSANFMLSDSPLHGRVCAVCAEACEACAKSCEAVGDMHECVEESQRCAKSCRTMT